MASNTSPSWQEPARLDVEVADVAQGPAAREAQVAERRQRGQRLSSQQLPHLKAETMFLQRRPRLWPTTTRDCLFTLFRIENSIAFRHISKDTSHSVSNGPNERRMSP